jgi:hypothetical protein
MTGLVDFFTPSPPAVVGQSEQEALGTTTSEVNTACRAAASVSTVKDSFNDLPKAPQLALPREGLSGEGGLGCQQKPKPRKPLWYPKRYSFSYDTLSRMLRSNPGMPGRLMPVFDI